MPTKNTISDFIRKARAVHGNRYDYSQVEYINNKTPVKIICKKHGSFLQRPDRHLYCGCLKCGIEKKKKDLFVALRTMIRNIANLRNLCCVGLIC